MSHGMSYRVHRWVSRRSHMSQRWNGSQDRLHIGQRWITHEWLVVLQIDHTWVTCGQTLLHIGLRWTMEWVINGLMGLRWVTNGSHKNHTLDTLSNTTFLIFFSTLINLWPRHNFATIRKRKMNVIFDQSEESKLVVSLSTLLWHVTSWFFAHYIGEIISPV